MAIENNFLQEKKTRDSVDRKLVMKKSVDLGMHSLKFRWNTHSTSVLDQLLIVQEAQLLQV